MLPDEIVPQQKYVYRRKFVISSSFEKIYILVTAIRVVHICKLLSDPCGDTVSACIYTYIPTCMQSHSLQEHNSHTNRKLFRINVSPGNYFEGTLSRVLFPGNFQGLFFYRYYWIQQSFHQIDIFIISMLEHVRGIQAENYR